MIVGRGRAEGRKGTQTYQLQGEIKREEDRGRQRERKKRGIKWVKRGGKKKCCWMMMMMRKRKEKKNKKTEKKEK